MNGRTGVGLLAAALLIACTASCAYYNTLYNARKIYREAEKAAATGSAQPRDQREKYESVVEKCANVITEYPGSRWVDDAVFLMGMALLRQDEYEKSIRKFQEILTNFPDGEYAPQARYWLAFARYRREDYEPALADVNRFLEDYPQHELRFETLFLGGDIERALGEDDAAIAFYGRVAETGTEAELLDEARVRSADLFFARGDWERAAANYERVLRKGLAWERRYAISLRLGECRARTGECRESLELTNGLMQRATAQQVPPILLARGAGYECTDSLGAAFAVYDEIIAKYPKSMFSAEAYYRKGVLFDERLDSLRAAEEAFSKVGGEYANSPFAAAALEKSGSMKRLLDLRRAGTAGETADQAAEKLFLSAEIQLVKLGDVGKALAGYEAVLDSFPAAAVAPRAAYAVAWIQRYRLDRPDSAAALYRGLVERYPGSPQVKGALYELETLGEGELALRLRAYADSALAANAAVARDTLALSPPPDSAKVDPIPGARVPPADTVAAAPLPEAIAPPPDSSAGARGGNP